MAVILGMSGEVAHSVTDADTAVAVGSGTVEVLGTPRLLAWIEEATLRAVEAGLRDTDVCVGTRVHLEHVAATPVGGDVVCRAVVSASDGRIVTFEVEAHRVRDGHEELIAHGEVVRVVLRRDSFLERAQASGSA